MELIVNDPKRTRTITPFPDRDPDFSVEIRRLSQAEMSRIYDAEGYNDAKGRTMQKLDKVLVRVAQAAIVRVNGATRNGAPLDPTAPETKQTILDARVQVDGVVLSLFDHISNLAAEEEKAELGN